MPRSPDSKMWSQRGYRLSPPLCCPTTALPQGNGAEPPQILPLGFDIYWQILAIRLAKSAYNRGPWWRRSNQFSKLLLCAMPRGGCRDNPAGVSAIRGDPEDTAREHMPFKGQAKGCEKEYQEGAHFCRRGRC